MKPIYLAGAMSGLTFEDANGWREFLEILVKPVKCLSPMRDLPESYKALASLTTHDNSDLFTAAETCLARDLLDIEESDIIVANLGIGDTVSVGTVMEISYAYAKGKTVIAIMGKPQYNHPFVVWMTSVRVQSVWEAARLVRSFKGLASL